MDRNVLPQNHIQNNNFQHTNNQMVPHNMNPQYYNNYNTQPNVNQNFNNNNLNMNLNQMNNHNQMNQMTQMNKLSNIVIPNQDFRNPQMQNFNPLISNPHTFPMHQQTLIKPQIPIIVPQNQPNYNRFNPNFHDQYQVPINQPFNPLGVSLNRGDMQEIPHIQKSIMVNPMFNPQQNHHNPHNMNTHQVNPDMYNNNMFNSPYLVEREKLLFNQNDRVSNFEGVVEINFKEERIKEMNSEELSSEIYEIVVSIYPKEAAKITGMLSDLGDDQMRKLLLNPMEMKDLMDQAYRVRF
jgi:hypothetical protein